MLFKALKPTVGNRLLLTSDSGEPVARPRPFTLSGKKVGIIRETIGAVASPIYVADLLPDVEMKKLFGKKLESG
jgi:hypothetical protein